MTDEEILLEIIREPRSNCTEEMEAALTSKLLPEALRIRFIHQVISRLIDRVQGTIGFSDWEDWAKKCKNGEDVSADSAIVASRGVSAGWLIGMNSVAEKATQVVQCAAYGNYKRAAHNAALWSSSLTVGRDEKQAAEKAERIQQKKDLLFSIDAQGGFIMQVCKRCVRNWRKCDVCQYEGEMVTWLPNSKVARFTAIVLMLFYILPGLLFIAFWWGAYRCPACGNIGDNLQVPRA